MRRYLLNEEAHVSLYCLSEELPQSIYEVQQDLGPAYEVTYVKATKGFLSSQISVDMILRKTHHARLES